MKSDSMNDDEYEICDLGAEFLNTRTESSSNKQI